MADRNKNNGEKKERKERKTLSQMVSEASAAAAAALLSRALAADVAAPAPFAVDENFDSTLYENFDLFDEKILGPFLTLRTRDGHDIQTIANTIKLHPKDMDQLKIRLDKLVQQKKLEKICESFYKEKIDPSLGPKEFDDLISKKIKFFKQEIKKLEDVRKHKVLRDNIKLLKNSDITSMIERFKEKARFIDGRALPMAVNLFLNYISLLEDELKRRMT